MRISYWRSDVCSSDLARFDLRDQAVDPTAAIGIRLGRDEAERRRRRAGSVAVGFRRQRAEGLGRALEEAGRQQQAADQVRRGRRQREVGGAAAAFGGSEVKARRQVLRSEEHTSELQSLMRISYAVFCLKKKNKNKT